MIKHWSRAFQLPGYYFPSSFNLSFVIFSVGPGPSNILRPEADTCLQVIQMCFPEGTNTKWNAFQEAILEKIWPLETMQYWKSHLSSPLMAVPAMAHHCTAGRHFTIIPLLSFIEHLAGAGSKQCLQMLRHLILRTGLQGKHHDILCIQISGNMPRSARRRID